ncbi:ketopantoate reductase PanE/ApbA-domain-containing protein [Xylogone sp. PMI_703]|nr:ketopantoate reductase PanE/ApbA-domain-containing protein [Xylogone sp. PMI_703]
MAEKTNVLLFGLGAIGSFYAFILSRGDNVSLTVVARSNYEAVKNNGLIIDSEVHGKHTCYPDKVVRTPAEAAGVYDYVVCANKAIDQDSVPKLLNPVVDESTTLVIIQNGVGNEEPFRETFPECTIISCVTWVGASQAVPGIIKHTKSEHTQIGLYPNPKRGNEEEQKRLDQFVALLRAGNTPVDMEEDLQLKRWEKVVWNAAWNSLTTLTLLDTQSWLKSSPNAMPMTRELMREVIDVGRKCGVPLQYNLIDQLINKILAMPGIGSSMQADRKAGRKMEVEIILGYPVRKARELQVPVPVLDTLYTLLTAINGRL